VAIALVVTGFVVRRTLVPQILHYLAYRPPQRLSPPPTDTAPTEQPEPPQAEPSIADSPAPAPAATPGTRGRAAPREHLTERDREELESILKRRGR